MGMERVAGRLPSGRELVITAPSGEGRARVAYLGAYPAATLVHAFEVGDEKLNLPVEVERESFEPQSASGRVFEREYVRSLGLTRADVLVTDMWPFYLANTSASGKRGRTMAENVRRWEQAHGPTGIESRPPPNVFVREARDRPGNMDRLRQIFADHRPALLLTLGTEAAAFVREWTFGRARSAGDGLFYDQPVSLRFAGVELRVVHLVHPHMFIKKISKWTRRHEEWCASAGRALVEEAARSVGT